SKLDLTLATGNNPTLFDNAGGSERTFTPAQLALMLLTFQCFSPGGRISVAEWNNRPTLGNGSSEHAPCIADNMLHAIVRGENLLDTIHLNLMTKDQAKGLFDQDKWGKPVWEAMPQGLNDKPAISNATGTYLGRLVPLSRCIRLNDDCRTIILANGLNYPKFQEFREPTATVVLQGGTKRALLRASVEKAIWRELHALVVLTKDKNSPGGPVALANVRDAPAFDLWVGGLVAKQAKLIDAVEAVFHVPKAMLYDRAQRLYEQGVRHSEMTEDQLCRAISAYRLGLETNTEDLGGLKRRFTSLKNPELERLRSLSAKAIAQFWSDVEQAVPLLLDIVTHPEQLGDNDWHKTKWGEAVWRAAITAYEHACPRATPRQMRAYVFGLQAFTNKDSQEAEK
ncbi:MAG: type I-E CRISPR-associated protein Cse1/CasA, partial [Verrucomicrobiales bacterium]|nr:type I-E CRISPR-associated protein Cse1/CasA [Verrucomicrobiales bacterium]